MSVPQYHPGKVMEIFRPADKGVTAADASVQALVRMWDGHTLTVDVEPKIKSKIKRGDVVLVDYYPNRGFKTPIPRIAVSKILRGEKARQVVSEYKEYRTRMRNLKNRSEGPAGRLPGRYIG